MRGWTAAGGRLVIAGGTAGPKTLTGFPDALLPYRPVVTTDVPPASLIGLLGELPAAAATLPAMSGQLIGGRALATVAGRAVAAERAYGSGSVTLLGFDPSAEWIADTDTAANLWRRLLPPRGATGLAFADDSMLVGAVLQLPALALPSIAGLIALFGAYIMLIGPLNYLVLKRLDRREWAWLTMPALIVTFAIAAYAIGGALRGSELIVNEVAIVRGAAGATDGAAQIYLGIFSPSRGVYQVRVPGGPLLSTPVNAEMFGGTGSATALDVLQGDPAQVRDLAVGFGSLRAIRAETAVAVPLIQTDLQLVDGRLKGTVKNASGQVLERPAVVLGGTVTVLDDLQPGAEARIDVVVQSTLFGQSLSDRVVGQILFREEGVTADVARSYVRHNMIDQLTYDPFSGSTNLLSSDGPVVLAWGTGDLVRVEIAGQTPTHVGNVLYYVPAGLSVRGLTTFGPDLMRSTVVASDAAIFSKDPRLMNFGRGSATVAYRPIGFDGRITATQLTIGLNFGDPGMAGIPMPVDPLASNPPPCPDPPTDACNDGFDGLPDVEVFDIEAQTWRRLPHLTAGSRYAVADPARFVDPSSGTALVRYVNERSDAVGFGMDVTISGTIE